MATAFMSKAFAKPSNKSMQQQRDAAIKAQAARREWERHHAEQQRIAAIKAEAAKAAKAPIMGTFHCCICVTDFQRDITNDPDGSRPSPFGDTCDTCRAAGKQRPFEAAGGSVYEVLKAAAKAVTDV